MRRPWMNVSAALTCGWVALAMAACVPPTTATGPERADCQPTKPAIGAACEGTADKYCAYVRADGAEDVCYCETEGWRCFDKPPSGTPVDRPGETAPPTSAATVAPASSVPPGPAPSVEPAPEPVTACPSDMEFVDTVHCTKVRRTCKRKSRSRPNNLTICHEFAEGTTCVGDKRRQRYCIDRYEYPSKKGAHPPVMVSAYDAARMCEEQGKRMCFESEWTAACEGPKELPFPYGHTRSKDHCNIDNTYVHPRLSKAESRDEAVRGPELLRLDQSVLSGSMETCKSDFGVYDQTGNFDEWVRTERRRGKGKWAGLKGGAWGVVRNACRPMTTSHVSHWSYYFISFRCCKAPDAAAVGAAPDDGIPLWSPPKTAAPQHPAKKPLDRGWTPKTASAG